MKNQRNAQDLLIRACFYVHPLNNFLGRFSTEAIEQPCYSRERLLKGPFLLHYWMSSTVSTAKREAEGYQKQSLYCFRLHDPIVWRWSGKRPKTLVIRFTLEVLICELNSSTIWIFPAPDLWAPLCNLLPILVAHTIVHDSFVLLVDSAIGLRRVALARFTHTIVPYRRISVISSNQITCTRGCISARLGARNGHHILLTLGLVMRLLHLLLHESTRQPEQRFFSWNMVLTLHALEASRLAHLFHVHRASYLPHVAINYCIVCHGYVAYEEVWF